MTLATVPRYGNDQKPERSGHAVVIGASMAGLLAARILTDEFDKVTVIDRDSLPDEPHARRGVPQAKHLHILLEAAHATLEDLFPGYGEELISAGGIVIDGSRDVNFYTEGDFLTEGQRRMPLYCATRPLYEQLVRRRVAAFDGVTLQSNCQFNDYIVDDGATTVEGVVVTQQETKEISADLVIDATGRTSRTPAWLEKHGYPPPVVDEVHVDLAYSSTLIERPVNDRRAFLLTASPPVTRGGAALPIEGGRWLVTLFGLHGDHPPTDKEEIGDFAAGLATPELKRLLDEHRHVSEEISHYPFPSNRRYSYEELDRFPDGLVVIGDAIASFNPIYGQGMSVAALEALALHRTLATADREELARHFFERVAPVTDIAWKMAVGADFQFPQTTGPKPRGTDIMNRYLSQLTYRAHTDGVLSDAFFRVLMMEQPPSSLLRPEIVWRVFKPTGVNREITPRPPHESQKRPKV
jgi:2-polyprenyl-6-methoxyphenol hydroxylase-like FAD-dependent oxidoreductase